MFYECSTALFLTFSENSIDYHFTFHECGTAGLLSIIWMQYSFLSFYDHYFISGLQKRLQNSNTAVKIKDSGQTDLNMILTHLLKTWWRHLQMIVCNLYNVLTRKYHTSVLIPLYFINTATHCLSWMTASPSEGVMAPVSILKVVVFPAPLIPSRPKHWKQSVITCSFSDGCHRYSMLHSYIRRKNTAQRTCLLLRDVDFNNNTNIQREGRVRSDRDTQRVEIKRKRGWDFCAALGW